jgi:hypothetical protein
MSADAKVWKDGLHWSGICDAELDRNPFVESYHLSVVVLAIEDRMGQALRWEFARYPGDALGLKGYLV